LNEVSEKIGIDFNHLWNLKKDGIAKIWIVVKGYDGENSLVAYNTKKCEDIIYTNSFSKHLLNMDFIKPEKKKRVLDTDLILEKISKFGISSLKPDEKEYLDSLK
jgi:HJR/Mrr/RecB family endonuclease